MTEKEHLKKNLMQVKVLLIKKKKGKGKGKVGTVKQQKLKKDCNASCTMKCSEVFDVAAIMELFNNYWALPNVAEKLSFFKFRTTQSKVQRKQKTKLDSKKKF